MIKSIKIFKNNSIINSNLMILILNIYKCLKRTMNLKMILIKQIIIKFLKDIKINSNLIININKTLIIIMIIKIPNFKMTMQNIILKIIKRIIKNNSKNLKKIYMKTNKKMKQLLTPNHI